MRKTFQILPLIALIAAASGCSAQNPPAPPAHLVGGPCSYVSRDTVFTVVAQNTTTAAVEVAFAGTSADLSERMRNAEFIASFTTSNPLKVVAGQSFPGKIQQEISGACTPMIYSVIIGGLSHNLEPRAKPAK